jgi:hypothetical protein
MRVRNENLRKGYRERGVVWNTTPAWYPSNALYSTTNLILLGLVVIAGWFIYKKGK